MNLLFVYKQGPLVPDNCGGQFGCGLDVYADDGTGYKKALGWEYALKRETTITTENLQI
jgi:hypothetical protein